MEWSNIFWMGVYGQSETLKFYILKKKKKKVCFHNVDSTAFWYAPKPSFYYRSTHRIACKHTHIRGWSHKQQCDNTMKCETTDIWRSKRDSRMYFVVWSMPAQRKSHSLIHKEGVNCDCGSAIRILISLNDAPMKQMRLSIIRMDKHPCFFSKLPPSQTVKLLKKGLRSLIPSEEAAGFLENSYKAQLSTEHLQTFGSVLKEMQLVKSPREENWSLVQSVQ